jgi:hypothetical protein
MTQMDLIAIAEQQAARHPVEPAGAPCPVCKRLGLANAIPCEPGQMARASYARLTHRNAGPGMPR